MKILNTAQFISERMKIMPVTNDELDKVEEYGGYDPKKVEELWDKTHNDIRKWIDNTLVSKLKYPNDKANRIKNSLKIYGKYPDKRQTQDFMYVEIDLNKLLENSDNTRLDEEQWDKLLKFGLPINVTDDFNKFSLCLFRNLKNVMKKTGMTENMIKNNMSLTDYMILSGGNYFYSNSIAFETSYSYVKNAYIIKSRCLLDMETIKYGDDRERNGNWRIMEPMYPKHYENMMIDLYLAEVQDIINFLDNEIIKPILR